ncbi:MAG: Beta-galactosidase, partial [Actinomycetia bacterium]|nr:Beta-galactosidase [Actinomycetes bacterium]
MQIPYTFHNLQRCWLQVLTGVLLGSLPIKAEDVALPEGVKAVWNLEKAQHQTTPTREQFSLNGLWRWQPAQNTSQDVPGENWGYFKVPGSWPGITDYMQKDSQVIFSHPAWKNQKISDLTAAWYEREFSVPNSWNGRRIDLKLEYLNSFASVLIDGRKAGELQFHGGELDVTSFCTPGQTHHLRLLVVALPLKG